MKKNLIFFFIILIIIKQIYNCNPEGGEIKEGKCECFANIEKGFWVNYIFNFFRKEIIVLNV
jgi:hypothetical protein